MKIEEQMYDIHYDAVRPDRRNIWWFLKKWKSGFIRCTKEDLTKKRWSKLEQNKFIESILTRIPISGIYFTENIKTGNLTVIEGKQRFLAVIDFYFNLLRLSSRYEELNDKTFEEMAPLLQNRFKDTSFSVYIIQAQTSEELLKDILNKVK